MGKLKSILLTLAAFFVVFFIILPLTLVIFSDGDVGNVAVIPIEGMIVSTESGGIFGSELASSNEIVNFVEKASKDDNIKVIMLDINSPGGSAVASDEIAYALKKSEKPVVALIREVGASGGYWIASTADHIVANRMSITGSIGVISSYLEFSGMMEEYGVGYERMVSGDYKDMGTPFKKLTETERTKLQSKMNKIHDYFIDEVAKNRDLNRIEVSKIATGEFYLGVEALELNLIDELGNQDTALKYIQDNYELEKIDLITYKKRETLLDVFSNVISNYFFNIGRGFGSFLLEQEESKMNQIMLV